MTTNVSSAIWTCIAFFAKKPMDMDRNIEQEFEILVTVYADKIIVTEVTESDWDEGGAIG